MARNIQEIQQTVVVASISTILIASDIDFQHQSARSDARSRNLQKSLSEKLFGKHIFAPPSPLFGTRTVIRVGGVFPWPLNVARSVCFADLSRVSIRAS